MSVGLWRQVNRIKISPLATAASSSLQTLETVPSSLDNFEKIAAGYCRDFSIFVPMHYEKNHSYPLIVWLHSNGSDSQQLQRMMPETSLRNYVGIAPQAGDGSVRHGFYWQQNSAAIDQAHESVMAAIDHASIRFNIAAHRVFLAGFGAGGEMAFRIALQSPEIFAGVISINGQVPKTQRPLRSLQKCRELPVFWAHYRQSVEFLQEDLCDQLRLLHVGGFCVTLRQYPSGDQLSSATLSDVNHWIMEVLQARTDANIVR